MKKPLHKFYLISEDDQVITSPYYDHGTEFDWDKEMNLFRSENGLTDDQDVQLVMQVGEAEEIEAKITHKFTPNKDFPKQ